jgi:putative transposase
MENGPTLEPHLPAPRAPGRPRVHTLREVLDAVFYIVRSGCAWRLLPHDFPPWKTIHHYFRTWRKDGTWERVHAALRERLRVRMKRDPEPSAGIVDSQSVKSTGVQRGYDYTNNLRTSLLLRGVISSSPAPPPLSGRGYGLSFAGFGGTA